jgi:hypothetical protein
MGECKGMLYHLEEIDAGTEVFEEVHSTLAAPHNKGSSPLPRGSFHRNCHTSFAALKDAYNHRFYPYLDTVNGKFST